MKLYLGGVKIKMIILNAAHFLHKSLQKPIRIAHELFMRTRSRIEQVKICLTPTFPQPLNCNVV